MLRVLNQALLFTISNNTIQRYRQVFNIKIGTKQDSYRVALFDLCYKPSMRTIIVTILFKNSAKSITKSIIKITFTA